MVENLFKKLHIKTNPNKIMTILLYAITVILVFMSISRMLGFLVGDARIENKISPYLYAIFLTIPPLAFSFFVNSGIPKNDRQKIKFYMVTCILFGVVLGGMACTWINQGFWWLLQRFPNYNTVKMYFPELFAPAIKTACFAVPFVAIFNIIDYFLLILRDEDLPKSIAGFCGLSLTGGSKDNGMFTCETIICNEKDSAIPIVVPEKKRYEGTLVQGATGTGKSVLLNTIALHYKKYPNSKVFIFDKSASSRVLTQAMGGNFYNLLVDDSIAFQPLSNITNSTERIWVNEWLLRYAESRNANLTESEKMALSNALFSLSNPSYPKEDLTITTLKLQIQDEKWRILLSNLQGVEDDGGTYGKLFDSNVDKFGEGNWQVFEMEKIMENEAIVGPTLDYLFHRIEGQLTGEPALIILDECWLFLRNKAFRKKIIEYIKDLRKKNASIIMATQNLSDIDDEMLPVITENMLTKIYLANSYINEHSRKMYALFGLNDKEIDLVKNLHAKKQYFYKSTLGGRIFDLALSPTEFKFVSATSKRDQLKVAQLQSLPPDEFIEVWKEEGPLLPEN